MTERLGKAELELTTSDKGLEKGVGRAEKSSRKLDKQFDKTKKKSREVGSALSGLGGRAGLAGSALVGLTGAGLGLAGGLLVVGGALAKARQAVTEFDRVGKAARASGLDPEAYQEYAYAADLAGLSIKEFDKGARTLFKNANDAALGTGLMKTSLERLNPELLKNIINARSQEERIRLVADAVKKSTNEIEKAAIAQAAFGGKGTAFINFLDQGADGFDRLSTKAREMGIIISNDVVRNAEQMNDKLSTASTIIDANLNKAFVDLAPVLVYIAELTADIVREFASLLEGFKAIENQTSKSLDDGLAVSGLKRIETETKIFELQQQQRDASGQHAKVIKQAIGLEIDRLNGELSDLTEQEARAIKTLSDRDGQKANHNVSPIGGPPLNVIAPKKTKKASISEAEKQRLAILGVIDALQFEASQLGLTNVEQRINNELKNVGVSASSLAGEKIAALVESIEAEKLAIEASNEAAEARKQKLEELEDLQARVGEGAINVGLAFGRGAAEGKQALIQLGVQLLQLIAQSQALEGGGFLSSVLGFLGGGGGASGGANILSSIFGSLPGFDNGTSFTVGGMGGIDNNLVAFRASRGETVDVKTPGQQRGNGGRLDIHLIGHEGGTFMPRVKEIAGDVANVTVREASPQIVGESVRQSGENVVPTFSQFREQKAGGDYRT